MSKKNKTLNDFIKEIDKQDKILNDFLTIKFQELYKKIESKENEKKSNNN